MRASNERLCKERYEIDKSAYELAKPMYKINAISKAELNKYKAQMKYSKEAWEKAKKRRVYAR